MKEERKAYLKELSVRRYDSRRWGEWLEVRPTLTEEELAYAESEYRNYWFPTYRGCKFNDGGRCVDAFQYQNECGGYEAPEKRGEDL